MAIGFRTQTRIGETYFVPDSIEEPSLVHIAVITEGECEEVEYFQGLREEFEIPSNRLTIINELLYDFPHEKGANPVNRLESLKSYVEYNNPDYRSHDDFICLVCDRDDRSFSSEQYDKVARECEHCGYTFVCSNPSFQLWLLFHFTADITELTTEDYPRSKEQIEWIEKRLKSYHRCFRKGYEHGHFREYLPFYITRVGHAVDCTRELALTSSELKETIGSNMHILVTRMIQNGDLPRFRIEEARARQVFIDAGLSIF